MKYVFINIVSHRTAVPQCVRWRKLSTFYAFVLCDSGFSFCCCCPKCMHERDRAGRAVHSSTTINTTKNWMVLLQVCFGLFKWSCSRWRTHMYNSELSLAKLTRWHLWVLTVSIFVQAGDHTVTNSFTAVKVLRLAKCAAGLKIPV